MEETGIVPHTIDKIPLSEAQVENKPLVLWTANEDSLYTLAFIDPDLQKEDQQFLHWLVINIPGGDVTRGDHYVPFMGSATPEGTGVHRYIFLVFKQSGKLKVTDHPQVTPPSLNSRMKFNMREFERKYHLGPAIAGTFYRSEYEQKQSDADL